jgi:hypothetical protein
MNALSTAELSHMQAANTSAMWDTCCIVSRTAGLLDEFGNPADVWTEGADLACGLDMRTSYEVLQGTQVPVRAPRLRLPFGTVVTNLDRIKITKRYGVTLAAPLMYEIIGPPRQGPVGVQIDLKTATSV